MFWPIVLPFQVTFLTFAALVATAVAIAPKMRWKRVETFFFTLTLAAVAFIPSCTGVMHVVDQYRFGRFEYDNFDEVGDFRARRYLPTSATQISMEKHPNGYRAKYSISESDFHLYLDGLWDEYGKLSAVARGTYGNEGAQIAQDDFDRIFGDLGWERNGDLVVHYSPTEPDGGGATYYFDSSSGEAFQRTGYW